jgi:hypothetical protein
MKCVARVSFSCSLVVDDDKDDAFEGDGYDISVNFLITFCPKNTNQYTIIQLKGIAKRLVARE